jgi:DNA-binding transcriptional LysR family regulator
VQIVYPHRRGLSPRAQVFSNWMTELLGPYLN